MNTIPDELFEKVMKWRNFPRERPDDIQVPELGQESVWDYPRPPRLESVERSILVEFNGVIIAKTRKAIRVIETAGPPVYYIPQEGIRMEYLEQSQRTALCEWKGVSQYWSVSVGSRVSRNAGWSYPNPWEGYENIVDHIAFNASKMDACYVDDDKVIPQPGNYYGGWITPEIIGPFKGEPGTERW